MKRRAALFIWLAAIFLSLGWIAKFGSIATDLTAFLPRSPDARQQILIDQLREGSASRLILIALEGADGEALADASRAMARKLRADPLFSYVNNGEPSATKADRDLVMRYRYLLSPAVGAESFSVPALRAALERDLALLSSPLSAVVKRTIPADPTQEAAKIAARAMGKSNAIADRGVWFSKDGRRALIVAEIAATGWNLDTQRHAVSAVNDAYKQVVANPSLRMQMTGPAVFAVEARATAEQDSWRLTLIAAICVIALLIYVYRDARLVLLAVLPLTTGLLVGIAAVDLIFGFVHGITLAFGATLIGEAVDYPSYLFTRAQKGETLAQALPRIWPTLRLAVLTTVCGALTLLLSDITGLAQLGVLTVSGVLAAGLTTRWAIPALYTRPLHLPEPSPLMTAIPDGLARLRTVRWLAWPIALLSFAILAAHQGKWWNDDLADLSPISGSQKALDRALRADLGAPDVRYLIVVTAPTQDAALRKSEQLRPALDALVARGRLSGYTMAADFLPSFAAQAQRRLALPSHDVLYGRLAEALSGLPFQPGLFEPFINDVEAARVAPMVTLQTLQGTGLGAKVRALLFPASGRWVAIISPAGVTDFSALQSLSATDVWPLDLKQESGRLVAGYRAQSLAYTALGIGAIMIVLAFGLRRPKAIIQVLAPVFLAVVVTAAILVTSGERLTLFHIVSFLLVVGIGLNYALFFHRADRDEADRRRTRLSLTLCGATTLSAFGTLMFSHTPVLHAIGMTVALGAVAALIFSGMIAANPSNSDG